VCHELTASPNESSSQGNEAIAQIQVTLQSIQKRRHNCKRQLLPLVYSRSSRACTPRPGIANVGQWPPYRVGSPQLARPALFPQLAREAFNRALPRRGAPYQPRAELAEGRGALGNKQKRKSSPNGAAHKKRRSNL
jgi:hypothetical protein